MYTDLDSLAAQIHDGAKLALPTDYAPCAQSIVRRLIRRGVKNLHIVGLPTVGYQGDLLIGAGCVGCVELAAVTLGERGPAHRFMNAVKTGTLRLMDATCPAVHAGLQAAEKGIPFMPLRGILGSDVLEYRKDWRVLDNPFAADDPIVLIPAIKPDIALFHAPLADRAGNVWVGIRRELMLAAHAARKTLVTVEETTEKNLIEDERYAAGTIPSLYVSAIAEAPRGAWPTGLPGHYEADVAHLERYTTMARTDAGFADYLAENVYAQEVDGVAV